MNTELFKSIHYTYATRCKDVKCNEDQNLPIFYVCLFFVAFFLLVSLFLFVSLFVCLFVCLFVWSEEHKD